MYKFFKNYITNNHLLQENQKILIACSGGADSMCLLFLMQMLAADYNLKIAVCHVNHNLRALESDNDAEFVSNYCLKHNLDCKVVSVNVQEFAANNGFSIEQAARIMRYEALNDIKEKMHCNLIATAHNQNDQAETFLLNMLRGAGINGLKGMLPKQVGLIRPLLEIQRSDIETFCLQHSLEYCQDSTNNSMDYLRNRVRHQLLPILKEYNPNITKSLTRNMQAMRLDAEYLNIQAQKAAAMVTSKVVDNNLPLVFIDLKQIRALHQSIVHRVFLLAIEKISGDLKNINQAHLLQLYKLSIEDTGSKKMLLPNGIIIHKLYDKISISRNNLSLASNIPSLLNIKQLGIYKFGVNCIMVKKETLINIPRSTKHKIYIPNSVLEKQELYVRNRMAGDYFELENGGHKSVKDFFVDQKIDKDERDSTPLLYLDKKLLCIFGCRCAYKTIASDTCEYWTVEYLL